MGSVITIRNALNQHVLLTLGHPVNSAGNAFFTSTHNSFHNARVYHEGWHIGFVVRITFNQSVDVTLVRLNSDFRVSNVFLGSINNNFPPSNRTSNLHGCKV